ncbi:hypothetical protein llg_33420 [Luteolibacter sp. LG18]|nr:hypothetical protein llg_33420 [Luteolibacter sp. LG18]
MGLQSTLLAAPAITATKDDGVAAGTRKLPGSTVTYTNTITNTSGTDAATGVTYTDPDDANAPTDTSTVSATAVAVDDVYPDTVLPNIGVNTATSSQFSVVTNDFTGITAGNPVAASSLTLTYDAASLNGGQVVMTTTGANVGKFTYTPPAGFTGTDSFNYVLSTANGTVPNKTAKVTLTVGGPVIWFVNVGAGAGDGRLNTPFNTLGALNAINDGTGLHPKINHTIFLYQNATAYTGPITLLNGQKLIGQDATATLASLSGVTLPQDSFALPAMDTANAVAKITNGSGNAVVLNSTGAAGTNTVRGLTIGSTTSGSGISGSGFGTLTVDDLRFTDSASRAGQALNLSTGTVNGTIATLESTSGTNGISLTTIGGSLTITTGSINGPTGADILISGGAGSLSYGGTITNSAGRSVDISSHTGGAITLSGAITDTGTGILLNSNGGTTFAFSGGITANTGSNTAFAATGGGTVTVTGTNTIGATTALTTTGVNIANTTIGASGVTFRSVSVNGGTNGIVLNTTGSTGGFTITGTGDTSVGGNNSGGTIQNTSGHGISLTSTKGVSLTNLNLQSNLGSGINGTGVTDFTFANGKINNSGDVVTESNISFNGGAPVGTNISGVVSITNSNLTNAFNSGIDFVNDGGTISNLTITGNTITSTTSSTTSKGYGISLVGAGTASSSPTLTKALVDSNTIRNFPGGGGIQVVYGNATAGGTGAVCGTPGNATNIVTITNNVARGETAANRMNTSAVIVSLSGATSGSRTQANFNISNNGSAGSPLGHCSGTAILIGCNGFSTATGTVNSNYIVANNTVASNGIGGGNGITVNNADTPDLTLTVNSNNISQVDGNGILLVGRGVTGTARYKIQSNTVAAPLTGTRPGIRVDAGNASSADDAVFVNISGNTSGGSGGSAGIGLRKQGTNASVNDLGIQGLSPSPANGVQMEDYVSGQNPGSVVGLASTGVNKGAIAISGDNFVATSLVPLMFAEGGVEAVAPVVAKAPAAVIDELPVAPVVDAEPAVAVVPEVAAKRAPFQGDLTESQLQATVEAAIERWAATGLNADQVALLRGMRFEPADLPGLRLGEEGGGLIRVDRKAGGNGWYVDSSPMEDSGFAGASTRLYTSPTGEAAGRMDLLTAMLHEMGHALGLDDSYRSEDRDNLMYGYLTKGERRLPVSGQARGAVPHDHDGGHFLTAPITIGTLPPGKSVVITATVTISNSINVGQISSQGTVAGTMTATPFSVLTDDPNVGGTADPTVTLIGIPPAFTSGNATTFKVGTAGTFNFAASGIPAPTFSTVSPLPGGVTLASNGLLSGTPAAGTGGTFTLSVKAANTVAPDATQSFTLTVNEAPTITSATTTTFETGAPGTFTVQTGHSFPANAALSVTGTLPSGVIFTDNGDGTATLSGTPAANAGGSYPLTFTANNGILPNGSQSFTLVVNQAAVFTSTNATTFTVGSAGSFSVTTTGYPISAITKTGALPSGVSLVDNGNGSATLAGTPAALTGGTYPITLIATNGAGLPVNQSFTLTVNQAAAITSANGTTFTVGSAGSFTITTTGFPTGAGMTLGESGTLPSGVSFTDNGNGTATLAGTPAAATGGTYPITINASNGIGSPASQSFTLTVNQAPAITSANTTSFTATQAGTFTVTTTGFPTNASMTISSSGSLPSGVTFTDNGNGTATLAGTPASGTDGSYPLTITASNGVSPQASQSFTLVVKPPVDHFTVTAPANATAGTAVNVTVTALDAANAVVANYQGTVHFTSSDVQAGLPSNYTFTAGDNGSHTFSVTLKTAGNQTVSVNDTLTVTAAGTSGSIAVVAGADAKLAFLQQPSNAVAGVAIAPAVTVQVQDAFGNPTTSTANVTVAIGTNPGSGTLSGTTTVAAVAGVATFNDLSINKTGTGYTLAGSSSGLTGATSGTFNITPAAANKLAFAQQPSNTVAGVAIAPAVTVQVQDTFGNLTTSTASVTVAIGTNPGSGTLSGTTTVAAVAGVATFSDLSINKIGTGYTLTGASSGLTGATSGTFNITPAAPNKLAFLQQPSNAVAGVAIAPAVTVQIQDTFGNLTTSTANVTVAIGTNPGSGTLSGTATVAAVAGTATFSTVSIDKMGTGYTLTGASSGLTGATSGTFNITPAAANKLAFAQQPSNAVAGVAIAPAVTVQIQDTFGNLTTSTANVTVAIGTNPGSGTLSGTATVAAVSGTATFSNLSIDKTGTGYTLTGASSGLTGATSGTFNITPAAPNKLAFAQQPSNTVAGVSIAPAVTVQIQDTFGNLTTSTANVTVAIGTNPGSGTLSGTATVAAVSGVATFSNLSIDKIGTGYTLTGASSGLTGATSGTFNITPAAPNKLAFLQQPSNAVAGVAIAPAVTVQIQDTFGNLTTSTANVTVAIGTNPGSGTLSGTATVAAVAGTATFSNLSIDKAGTGYTLTGASAGLTGATSGTFNITAAAPNKLAFLQQPSNTVAGVSITPAVTVQIQDTFGNLTTSTANVTVAIGTNPGSGTLSGTTTVAAVAGTATFSNLSINKTGTGYTLTGASSGLTGATSGTFNITPAAPNKLAFLQQPSNAVAGVAIAPAVTIQIQDTFGNLTTSTANVTVAIGTNPGSGTLSGTATVAAVSGTATFSNLSINKVGTGYTLTGASSGLTGATSGTFNITPAAATHYTVSAPANATAGTAFNVTVTALDQFDNTATGYAGTVHFTSSDAPATLPANSTLTNGVGTFSATLKTGGNQTITATDTVAGSITGTSGNILVDPRSDLAVTVTDSPDPVVAGTNLTYTITVVNNGPSAAASVSLGDTLPAGTTFVSLSSVGGWSPTTPAVGASGSITVTKASVAPAESASFTLVVQVAASVVNGTVISNTATVSTTTTELNSGNNSSTATTTVSTSADLSVTMTDSPDPVTAGQNITYTVNYSNAGPSDAAGVSVSDTLPAGTTFVSSSAPGGWSTSAPAVGSSGTVTFTSPSVANGGSGSFTIVAKVASSVTAGTVISNTATIAATTTDPSGGNNSATATTTVNRSSDLAITMSDSPDPVNATQNVTYTIDLTNNGPSDASSVSISDTLPLNTTFSSASAPAGWSTSAPAVGAAGTVTFTKSSFAAAATGQFTIVATVDLLAPNNSTLTNTATVTATESDPNSSNNSATTTTLVKSGADLAISGSASSPAIAGTDVTYTFTATNNGPLDADNAVVTDVLPVGTTFVSAVAPSGWTLSSAPAVGTNGTVTFTKASFANAATADFTVVAHISPSVGSGTVLHNGIAASSSTLDIFSQNSSASLDSTVITRADLAVTLTATPNPVLAAGNITYTIGVSNIGPSDATGASVSLPLPAATTFVSASGAGWSISSPAVNSGGTVTFSGGSLALGGSTSLTVVAKVNTGTANGTAIPATATVSGGSDLDPAGGNNSASASVDVGTVDPTPLQLATTGTLNRQTGMFELNVKVTNTTPYPINGFRLHVDYSAYVGAYPSLRLYNATSLNPDPHVDYPFPVPVDGFVNVKLVFYTSTRTFPAQFNPVLTVEKLGSSQVTDTNGGGVAATAKKLTDGTVLIEFPSIIGHWYRVRYSSDMVHWQDCPVPLQAGGTKVQWIDSGAPFTNISPADPSVTSRFYIVNEIAAP